LDIHGLIIRPATVDHIPEMLRLERSSNNAAHWSEQQYESLILANDSTISRLALVAGHQEGAAILGFLIAQHLGPEWELENIVVDPNIQGKGIGTFLLNALFNRAKQTNSESVFLEVRESNTPAHKLYHKLGFEAIGRRKSYYSNPLEDAVLYRRTL
jgi:[ribosomal protein S18]-alanine N-acetyltransferase